MTKPPISDGGAGPQDLDVPDVAGITSVHELYVELWRRLVPSSGHAQTVQGEAIRISGKIHYELFNNGGTNWDEEFCEIASHFGKIMASGNPLPDTYPARCAASLKSLPKAADCAIALQELAVMWVRQNPAPVTLGTVSYSGSRGPSEARKID